MWFNLTAHVVYAIISLSKSSLKSSMGYILYKKETCMNCATSKGVSFRYARLWYGQQERHMS